MKRRAAAAVSVVLFVITVTLYCGAASSSNGGRQTSPRSRPPGRNRSYPTDVLTNHYNNFRQGATPYETRLTLRNVNSALFGKIGFLPVDGFVIAQPLYVNKQFIDGRLNNTLYVVTENDSVYAFGADSGRLFWKVSVLGPGETPSDDRGCVLISPNIGISGTPVIDRGAGRDGAIYFVAMTKDSSGHYHQRLHALDLASGAELFGGPAEIQATYPGTGDGSQNGQVIFDPGQYLQRAGILQYGDTLYIAFTSHCDIRPYTSWIMAYSTRTLEQTSVINITPNGNEGGIWMGGAGLAADSSGNIFLTTGNGTFDTTLDSDGFPMYGDYGNAFVKLSTSGGRLQVVDYFTMYDTVQYSDADMDLGAGGVTLLPDIYDDSGQVHHLAVGAGKDRNLYVVDRDNMGKFNPNNDDAIYQEIRGAFSGRVFCTPVYFNNTLYYNEARGTLKAYAISNAKLPTTPTSQTANTFAYRGTMPIISSNQGSNAIVWAVDNSTPAALHAYDATDLTHELYNSNQVGSRDRFGAGNKFVTPVVANGKVFLGMLNGVAIFGLLR